MGREIRRVPAGWEHPCDEDGEDGEDGDYGDYGDYIPLFDGNANLGHPLSAWQRAWDEENAAWQAGTHPNAGESPTFVDWHGERPTAEEHTPELPAELLTHWQYYESTTEGTPLSPVFATPEELAAWLVQNGDGDKWTVDEALAYVRQGQLYVADLDGWRRPLGRRAR